MTYAAVSDVEAGFRTLSNDETSVCRTMLEEAALIIDAYNDEASEETKKFISCRMIRRAIGESDKTQVFPIGATQGSVSAGGYAQSWTIGTGGSTGQLYLDKLEKKMLGVGNSIGSRSPIEELVPDD